MGVFPYDGTPPTLSIVVTPIESPFGTLLCKVS